MKLSGGFKPPIASLARNLRLPVCSPLSTPSWEQACKRQPAGNWPVKLTLVEETEAKAGRLLKGRQILKMVYESHKLDEAIGQVFDIENVFSTTLKGDNLAKLLQDWDSVLAGQIEPISEISLKPLLHRQLLSSTSLKEEMAHHERALLDSEDKTYAALHKVLRRRVELNRQNRNRKALQSQHAGGGHAPALAVAKHGARGNKNKRKGDGCNAQNRKATPRGQSRGQGTGRRCSGWRGPLVLANG